MVKNKDHTDLVELKGGIQIKMKYPDIRFFQEGIDLEDVTKSMELISKCIAQIIDGEEVYNRADMSEKEIQEWLECLVLTDFKKVIEFFSTMPKLSHSFTIKNPNTEKEFTIQLNGLADFF